MDRAEIRFIQEVFIEDWVAESFIKIHRPRFCESPFQLQRHLVQLLAIGKQSANGAHSSDSGLLLNTYSC